MTICIGFPWPGFGNGRDGGEREKAGFWDGFCEKMLGTSSMSYRDSSWWLQRQICLWPRLDQLEMVCVNIFRKKEKQKGVVQL